jgi:hypothetical protein
MMCCVVGVTVRLSKCGAAKIIGATIDVTWSYN